MKYKLTSILLVLLLVITSCSSDVQDKNKDEVETAALSVQSIRINNTINNRAFIGSETITRKDYTVRACLAETARGQKIDIQEVQLTGAVNKTEMTDGNGCIFWEQKLNFDYSGRNLCQRFAVNIQLSGTNFSTKLEYTIDLIDDQLTDLSRSTGCEEKRELETFRTLRSQEGDPEIQLGQLNFEYVGTTTQRRSDVRYTDYESGIGSCLTNQIDNRPIRGALKIVVTDPDGINEDLIIDTETDEKGCFKVTFNSQYEQYKWAHWKKKNITITLQSGPFTGKMVSRDYFVNPWLEGTKFGYDSKYDNRPPENAVQKWNRVHIDQVMYVRVGNNIANFDVNNYLGLTTSKTYQIVLSPKVDRGHYFSNRSVQYVNLPDGPFKMKFMILAPKGADIEINENNFEDFEYITGVEKIVQVKNGYIQAFVNLPMRFADLPKIATRTVSVFQLEPVNNTGLIGTTVTGFFKAKINWIRSSVIQSDVLQTETQVLEERLAENYTPSKHQGVIESIEDQLEKGEFDINQIHNKFDTHIQSKSAGADEQALQDIKNLQFKKFVDGLLQRLDPSLKNGGYQDPSEVFAGTPKEIYHAHLKKTREEVKVLTIGSNFEREESEENFKVQPSQFNNVFERGIPLESDSSNEEFFKKLCRQIFPEKWISGGPNETGFGAWLRRKKDKHNEGDYRGCWKKPALKLKAQALRHTHRVKKVMPQHSTSFDFTIGSRLYTSYSTNYSSYRSIRNAVDLAGKVPFGDLLTQGIRIFDVSQTVSSGEQDTTSWSDDVSSHLHIGVEKFKIGLEGEFERCLQIEVKPFIKTATLVNQNLPLNLFDLIPNIQNIFGQVNEKDDLGSIYDDPKYDKYRTVIPTVYYMCNRPGEESFSEEWFFAQTYTPDTSLLSDSMGPTEIKFIKAIRGRKHFEQYRKAFEDQTKHYLYVDTSGTETPDLKLYENWGHIMKTENDPSALNKLIINNVESSFPGTYFKN
jgi:hypothetical protein